MKFSLIAAVVLLALAHGSFAQDAPNFERFGQYLEDVKNKLVQDLSAMMNNPDLANQAQSFIEGQKTQLEPMVSQMQEQLKSVATNVEEQIRPLAADMQAQLQPQIDSLYKMMQDLIEKIKVETKPIAN